MLLPFRLYSLENCPYCSMAKQFLMQNKVQGDEVVADKDPIIEQGAIKLTGKSNFPILVCRLTNEIITGWKEDEYKRVVATYNALYGTATSNLSVDGKPVVQEPAPTQGGVSHPELASPPTSSEPASATA